jgi:hypothetical protein
MQGDHMNRLNAQTLEPDSTPRALPSQAAAPAQDSRTHGELHAFGVDAEDGRWLTVTERCSGSFALQQFPFDERGLDALADRLARVAGHVKVCIGSRGARALDVAARLTRVPRVDLLLLFERDRPRGRRDTPVAHSHELAIHAERAI